MKIEGIFSKAKYRSKIYNIYSNVNDDDFSLELIDKDKNVFTVFLYEVELM